MFKSTYEDGVEAGKTILDFLQWIDPHLKDQLAHRPSDDDFEPLFSKFEENFVGQRKLTWSKGLLRTLLRDKEYESRLIAFWGLSNFFEEQENVAPICEIDSSLGFFQIGHFSGQGDGWILDTEYENIYHIHLGVTPETKEEVRSEAAVIISCPWQFYYHIHYRAFDLDMVPAPTSQQGIGRNT
ncbi:MAG: hypothetical protein AAF591_00545 [Verrucomicrobiota bacterium]